MELFVVEVIKYIIHVKLMSLLSCRLFKFIVAVSIIRHTQTVAEAEQAHSDQTSRSHNLKEANSIASNQLKSQAKDTQIDKRRENTLLQSGTDYHTMTPSETLIRKKNAMTFRFH